VEVRYNQTSYTVSEDKENAMICVKSTSPGIDENLSINITTESPANIASHITQSHENLSFSVNSTNPQLVECYTVSVDFQASSICEAYSSCSPVYLQSHLVKENVSDRVRLDEGTSTAEVLVEVPSQCGCFVSSSPSADNAAITAAAVLSALVIFAIVAIVVLVLVYRNKTKKLERFDLER
jgi:hypothetical protein